MPDKLIFVLLDGLSAAAAEDMGFLQHLREQNLCGYRLVRSQLPSLSRPLYETLLTGAPPYRSGITCNEMERASREESVFHLARAEGLTTACVGLYFFDQLYGPLGREEPCRFRLDHDGPIQHGMFYWDDGYPDSHAFADAGFLLDHCSPDFLVLHTLSIDHAGHLHGAGSKEHRERVMEADALLARTLPTWLDRGYQVLVTADHGMDDMGFHGGTAPHHRQVPLFAFSEKLSWWEEESDLVNQLAIAPLICLLLGILPPSHMQNTLWAEPAFVTQAE